MSQVNYYQEKVKAGGRVATNAPPDSTMLTGAERQRPDGHVRPKDVVENQNHKLRVL
jgi:hypothetical protein